jgi:hypothetical protein
MADPNQHPVPGAMRFLQDAVDSFQVTIQSARSDEPTGRLALKQTIHDWLDAAYGLDGWTIYAQIGFPVDRPLARLTVDGEPIPFTGALPDPRSLLWCRHWNDVTKGWT